MRFRFSFILQTIVFPRYFATHSPDEFHVKKVGEDEDEGIKRMRAKGLKLHRMRTMHDMNANENKHTNRIYPQNTVVKL